MILEKSVKCLSCKCITIFRFNYLLVYYYYIIIFIYYYYIISRYITNIFITKEAFQNTFLYIFILFIKLSIFNVVQCYISIDKYLSSVSAIAINDFFCTIVKIKKNCYSQIAKFVGLYKYRSQYKVQRSSSEEILMVSRFICD